MVERKFRQQSISGLLSAPPAKGRATEQGAFPVDPCTTASDCSATEIPSEYRTIDHAMAGQYLLTVPVFLEECQKYIDTVVETAVDDRRHGHVRDGEAITHLATA